MSPEFLSPTLLLNVLWNSPSPFTVEEEAQEFFDLLQNYWNDVARLIATTVAIDADPAITCIDIEQEDFAEDQPMDMMFAMRQWVSGFMRATEIWLMAWGTSLDRPDLRPHWEVLACFAKIEEPENLARMNQMTAENPPRTIARALREPFTIPGE